MEIVSTESICDGFGRVIHPGSVGDAEKTTLSQISREDVIKLFKEHGCLLFKGFNATLEDFESFTESFGISDPRKHLGLHGKNKDVFTGRGFLGPHAELSYTPWPPDSIWFFCVRPASEGGRTTVYDGVRFLAELDETSRSLFTKHRIQFDQFKRRGELTEDQVKAALSGYPDITYEFIGDYLHTVNTVSAINRTKFGNEPAFVNTIVHAFDDPDYYGLKLDDGSPIPDDVCESLRAIAARLALPISWEAGDLALVDNTRVMHGREGYSDTNRNVRKKHMMADF